MGGHDKEELTHVLSMYEHFFQEVWKKVSSIVGELTLELIIRYSIKRVLPAFGFLEDLKVSSKGIYFDKLKKSVNKLSHNELKKGFHALISEILAIFSIMWGEVIIRELSNKLREIEQETHHLCI